MAEIQVCNDATVEKLRRDFDYNLGDWVWVSKEDGARWLGCIIRIGSNFLEISEPKSSSGWRGTRVLLDEAAAMVTPEPNAEQVIRDRVAKLQNESLFLVREIQSTMTDLGMGPALPSAGGPENQIVPAGYCRGADDYKAALIKAKTETIPELQKQLKHKNEELCQWLGAQSTSLAAISSQFEDAKSNIERRIQTVSLYVGLGENAYQVRDGKPASTEEKIHVMQRKLYMDEECLVDYDAGGMRFGKISQFDEWLLRNGNLDRILPFPRCMVAFQVRRRERPYLGDGHSLDRFIHFQMNEADKSTFLYIRNGEQVYRLETLLQFDDFLFPSDPVSLGEPMMAPSSMPHGKPDLITVRAYEDASRRLEALESARMTAAESSDEDWRRDNEIYALQAIVKGYRRVDQSHLYFDEISGYIKKQATKYNQIAVILQGLLDRSDVFKPCQPGNLSNPDHFRKLVKPVLDGDRVLAHGEKPDFEAYRNQLNSRINENSVFVGQHAYWITRETERENERRRRSRYSEHLLDATWWKPEGNNGPGLAAVAHKVSTRTGKATFRWLRDKSWRSMSTFDETVPATITAPFEALLNASAYKAGDYKRFFADHRTRAEYLQWAPLLLLAEDYVAGRLEPIKPGDKT